MRHNIQKGSWNRRDVIAISDFSKEDILEILDRAKKLKEAPPGRLLQGKLMAACFFEPSTRTRLSFETAMKRMGGEVIGFSEPGTSSISKKETLLDTIRVIGDYADLIVIRHPLEGAARYAVEATHLPVINAGDGANQHPTQTLLDLFTIRESQGQLENLHVAIAGDLKYGRTVHSLVQAAAHFNMRLYFVAPEGLSIPKQICEELKRRSILFTFHSTLQEIMPKLDILYMTRIQEERMPDLQYEPGNRHGVNGPMLEMAKPTMKILHPLPRVKEIDLSVDSTPHAHYFEQSRNGVFLRQAILSLILQGGTL